ncbi:MAG: UDP-N-acetylmuramoylalanyl-D-glutamyl-2,6-diaminopimelate--D-alanyl-D-alanine ligase [Alphaproteobacteria bacterium]|nr:UDP-N-acetylmuramoylalanyl-D-glutamyl-2,6-diaminopimelate--D-alanyl-D-alanine ligase [Alphaproteobacteria bacterium]
MTRPMLWTSAEIAAATGAQIGGSWEAKGVSIDTRTIEPGDLFIALMGEARDGHEFAAEAVAKGAAGVLAMRAVPGVPKELLALVGDSFAGLEALGRAARARSLARIAAVTGSVGKTSTKEALRQALSRQGETHAAVASYNNHFGVPLTLARMPRTSRFGVFEIGMNHAGEITPLSVLTRPHAAIVTTVEPVHLEHFANVEAIGDAKGEIFAGLAPQGTAVLNRDNSQYERLRGHAERSAAGHIWSFGTHVDCEARLLDAGLEPEQTRVTASFFGERLSFIVGAPGLHLAMNSLGVLLLAKALGADAQAAAQSFTAFEALKGRGRQLSVSVPQGSFTVIDESYNANPASMRAAIALLGNAPAGEGGRRIAVLGDMLELGREEAAFHAAIVQPLRAAGTQLVFLCGPRMAHLWEALPASMRGAYGQTSADLAPLVAAEARAGDVFMVKGSNSSRMNVVVEALASQTR